MKNPMPIHRHTYLPRKTGMQRPRLSILLTIGLIAGCSVAQATESDKQMDACLDKATTTVAMQECQAAAIKAQDTRLNQAYKALMARSSPELKTELKAVQRRWIRFRDANCKFYALSSGGSVATLGAGECMRATTAHRADELEKLAKP